MPIFWMFTIEKWSVYKNVSFDFPAPRFFLPIAVKLGVGRKI